MADEVLVKYTADMTQLVTAVEKVKEELISVETTGDKSFTAVSEDANKAASSIGNVSKASQQASAGLKIAGDAAKKAKSDFNGLQSSINQISRELPAFTFSLQTGFLAISNNLPILADEINKVKAQNRALAAEGKQTKSVLQEVGGALFSWQTALSIGITLLTTLVPKLFETSKAQKDVSIYTKLAAEEQERYNKAAEDQIRRERREKSGEAEREYNKTLKENLKVQYFFNDLRGEGLKQLERQLKLLQANPNTAENAEKIFNTEQAIFDERIRREKLFLQEANEFGDDRMETYIRIADLENEKEANRIKFQSEKLKEGEDELLHSLERQKKLYEAAGRNTYELDLKIFDRRIALEKDDDIKRKDIIAEREAFIIQTARTQFEEFEKLRIQNEAMQVKNEADAASARTRATRERWDKERQEYEKRNNELVEIHKKELAAELDNEMASFERRREIIETQEQLNYITHQEAVNARMAIDKAETEARLAQISAVGNAISSIAQIVGENTEAGKALAIAATTIDTYVAAQRAFSGGFAIDPTGVLSTLNAAAAVVSGLARVQKIVSVNVPKPVSRNTAGSTTRVAQSFKDGVIDLEGPGTTTSDSIPAWLSRGESVIKASSTAGYKDHLRALNNSPLDYEALIEKTRVKPAIEAERKEMATFAENLVRSMIINGQFTDKGIIKELREVRKSNSEGIATLTETIAESNRKAAFEKRLYK